MTTAPVPENFSVQVFLNLTYTYVDTLFPCRTQSSRRSLSSHRCYYDELYGTDTPQNKVAHDQVALRAGPKRVLRGKPSEHRAALFWLLKLLAQCEGMTVS
jgi:hypothetical protein